jgi:hypothetical protein
MGYLKTKEEYEKNLYIELKNFIEKISSENKHIDEDDLYSTAGKIILEAEKITHYFEMIETAPANREWE